MQHFLLLSQSKRWADILKLVRSAHITELKKPNGMSFAEAQEVSLSHIFCKKLRVQVNVYVAGRDKAAHIGCGRKRGTIRKE